VLSSTSFKISRTRAARLKYFNVVSSGLLAFMSLELKLRGKTTTMSHGTPIYYVDLMVRIGITLEQAITQARELDEQRRACGFDQEALDASARRGLANGAFEELEEDVPALVDELYPEGSGEQRVEGRESAGLGLKGRLEARVVQLGMADSNGGDGNVRNRGWCGGVRLRTVWTGVLPTG
jgi:hypothetical protein